MSKALWKKGQKVDSWVIRFTVGEDYRLDQVLLPYDVEASLAHVHGLRGIGVLSADETKKVEEALDALLDDYAAGKVLVTPEDEDCHTVIENYLTDQLGETGKKVHTGRSRNDQVLAALRLYLREELARLAESTGILCEELITQGTSKDGWAMPGYTHTRQAMPSSVGAWALGYAELLLLDIDLLAHAKQRINTSPLGSAAGYGVPYLKMPRDRVAEELGFADLQRHVTSVQLSRGKFELEVVHALAQVALTMNRLASDLILFSSAEFGFATIAARHTTGSSIMPQKHNPDVLELIRASYHRITAEMQLLSSLPANLTSGYHRDLQLTKEAVMRAITVCGDCVLAITTVLKAVHFDRAKLLETMRSDTMATHEAMKMTADGAAFRDAYQTAAKEKESAMTPKEALEAYGVAGYPGRGQYEDLRRRLKKALTNL